MNWERWHTLSLLVIIVGVLIGGWLIARVSPLWAWIAVMILLTAFLSIAGKGVTGFWWGALIDDRNMMSLSRLQIILWTIVVLSGFLAAAMTNIAADTGQSPLAIQVPQQLWLLMGISTTSLVASPLIRSTKRAGVPSRQQAEAGFRAMAQQRGISVDRASDFVTARGVEVAYRRPELAEWPDLVKGEEVGNFTYLDLGKVQNLFFTLVLIIAYAVALGSRLADGGFIGSLPPLDTGMVTLLGISHAGYLIYKAVPHSQRGIGAADDAPELEAPAPPGRPGRRGSKRRRR
jgi:hypothetical protein